jgi:uncharacterized protein (TIGR02118 family)
VTLRLPPHVCEKSLDHCLDATRAKQGIWPASTRADGLRYARSRTRFHQEREELAMFKVVWVARFRDGISRADALRHWTTIHGPLAAKVSGIDRYVQNHVLCALGAIASSDEPTRFDGYSCCWYGDSTSFEASLRTREWGAIGADSPNLFDDTCWDGWSASLDARTIIDGDEAPFKTVWFVRFKDDVRADPARTREAHDYWIATHGGRFGARVPGISRYVQNHVVRAIDATGENAMMPMEFDGFSECWFEDRGAFERAMTSREWLRMNEDAEGLFDVEYSVPAMSAVLQQTEIVHGAGV